MAQILIRQLSDEAHRSLKTRAKRQNRSAESLAREILESSLLPKTELGLGDRIAEIWAGADVTDITFDRDKTPYEPLELS